MTESRGDEADHDRQLVARTKNTARYFVENRQVAWAALLMTLIAGVYGYLRMPKAKDPQLPIRVAVASCAWPGQQAEKVEQLVTRKIEHKLGDATQIEKLESISRTGLSIVYVTLRESITDRDKELDDIAGRLATITDLPAGSCRLPNGQTGPVQFEKDFGDTATLMLTVASPRASDVELDLRAQAVTRAIATTRGGATVAGRTTLLLSFPPDSEPHVLDRLATAARDYFSTLSGVSDPRVVRGVGFLGLDVATTLPEAALQAQLRTFANEHLRLSELHPDVWPLIVIGDLAQTRARLAASAGDRYSDHELDQFTDLVQRYLQRLPIVARVTKTGVVPEQITLEYSQDRLASYDIDLASLGKLLAARNASGAGGVIEIAGKNVAIDPAGELSGTQDLGGVVVATSSGGSPVYLRDLADISREYVSPPRFLSFLTVRDPVTGELATHRAITLAIVMRANSQIADFDHDVGAELATIRRLLPEDLILQRTSDQPRQVDENVHLFMSSLYEAVGLVVLVAVIGFWEWRSALLLALSIPITLAMTFAMMSAWGLDLQQVSIASLVIALGLLVDDPVVAGDAIQESIAAGWKPRVAAWLGPTKLAKAIAFATITNIASYLPFLTLTGDVGKFMHSMPIVLTMSLVASRIVSMTFVPLLAKSLLRPARKPPKTPSERRTTGFGRVYYAVVGWAIDHRKLVFAMSLGLLAAGGLAAKDIEQAFFPKDLSYLSFVDVWLPEDAPLSETRAVVEQARAVIAEAAAAWAKDHGRDPARVIASLTSFVGGGGPRFWFSVNPEPPQLNYAQLLIEAGDKHDTEELAPVLQRALARIPGARIDVRQLETGAPVGIPVQIRISGEDLHQLRTYARALEDVLRATPGASAVRDDWGNDTFSVDLAVDSDRASLSGVTTADVAASSAVAMNGAVVGAVREGDKEINIVTRLRADERAQISDLQNLYVISASGNAQKIPLRQVSHVDYKFQTEKIRRRDQFRTITVACYPQAGVLPSEVLRRALPEIERVGATFAPGYRYELGGEVEEAGKSLAQMRVVAILVFVAIFIALVVQFRSAIKPFIVFAALPYGAMAAVVSLRIAGPPLGFMAILGVISLMGVIVSHIIVLFDFIEEGHAHGRPMRETLLDAGLLRLRPVLVTVIATALGLIPLARHGGPLWEPLCYAQIGGLTFATVVTLVLVPVLYTIFIRDLKLVRWDPPAARMSMDRITFEGATEGPSVPGRSTGVVTGTVEVHASAVARPPQQQPQPPAPSIAEPRSYVVRAGAPSPFAAEATAIGHRRAAPDPDDEPTRVRGDFGDDAGDTVVDDPSQPSRPGRPR